MEAAGPDCPPNEITYNAVIDAFGKARQPAKATEWFGRMRAAGVAPDNITYNMYVLLLFYVLRLRLRLRCSLSCSCLPSLARCRMPPSERKLWFATSPP